MPQEIVFTALPFKRLEKEGKPYLKCSVHVSIKLNTSKDTTLSEFEDILEWPQKVLDSDFQFKLKNGDLIDAELESTLIDQALYTNLFHKDIKVDDFKEEDLTEKKINSFPIKHINDFVLKTYRQVSIESPKKLISPEFFLDENRVGSISRYKIDLKALEQTQNTRRRTSVKINRLVVKQDESEQKLNRTIRTNNFRQFSTAMNPADDFTELRKFHRVDREPVVRPGLVLKKPTFEYHEILAVVNSYPQIMKKLGLVLDFVIPFTSALPETGTLQLVPKGLVFGEEGTTVSIPATAYEITPTGFYAADKPDSIFRRGFVKINTSEFSVVQVDADGTALKSTLMTENKVHQIARFYEIRSELSVSKMLVAKQLDEVEPPSDEGLPYIRSAGIAITKNGMAEHLFNRIKTNLTIKQAFTSAQVKNIQVVPKSLKTNQGNSANAQKETKVNLEGVQRNIGQTDRISQAVLKLREPVTILYSSDIVQGYRMDIAYEADPEKWYSLHHRKDEYTWYDESNNPHPVEAIVPDEGYIQLGITEDPENRDEVFIPETLARWEGWSLSVRKPGYAINEASDYKTEPGETGNRDFVHKSKATEMRKYTFDPDLEFRVNAISKPVPGTLPKLRFGKDYRVRIRTVDLAGNSVPPEQQSESPSETIRSNIRYMRYEPLSSPIVLVGNELKDGEFLENMVIRSNFDLSSSQYENKYPVKGQKFDDYSLRYLLPPKNSQQIAENHG